MSSAYDPDVGMPAVEGVSSGVGDGCAVVGRGLVAGALLVAAVELGVSPASVEPEHPASANNARARTAADFFILPPFT